MPPVPILRTSEYLPNCSIVRTRSRRRAPRATSREYSLEWRDHEVVEPRIRLPVVEPEVVVARAFEWFRIVVLEEWGLEVVDEPLERLALALDPPVVALVGNHL